MAQTGEIDITEAVKAQGKTIDDQGNKINFMNFIILAILVVLFVGFAGIFVACTQLLYDSWINKATAYQELINHVQEQNTQIDTLTKALKQAKIIK